MQHRAHGAIGDEDAVGQCATEIPVCHVIRLIG
jgi:hypothetical protein